jgi:predicted 2-oxoglutarate/Fe(II)-dependent dioxygenase YbiX
MINQDPIYWLFPKVIEKPVLDLFLEESKTLQTQQGTIGKNSNQPFRKVSVQYPGEFNHLNLMLHALAIKANNKIWNYNLTDSFQCELLTYKETVGGKYSGHVDTLRMGPGLVRKLTVLAFLNDDYEGGKFFVMQDEIHKQYIETLPGSVLVFPTFLMHGVEEVTKGTRKSIVSWISGPDFK